MSYDIMIRMAADVARLQKDVEESKRIVKSGAERIQHEAARIKSAFAAIGLAVGVGAVISYFKNLTAGAIAAADNIGDLSAKVGVSSEFLSRYKLAADVSGTSLEGLAQATKFLSRNIFEAARGMKEQEDAFNLMGISVRNNTGQLKNAEQVMLEMAELFSTMPDGAAKTALAMRAMGRSGADMIPFLNQGADALRELTALSDALGLSLDENTIKAADRVQDNFKILSQVSQGLGNRIMRELLPSLDGITGSMIEAAKQTGAFDTVARSVAVAFKLLVSSGAIVGVIFKQLGSIVGGVVAAMTLALQGEFKAALSALKMGFADAASAGDDLKAFLAGLWNDALPKVDDKTRKLAKTIRELAVENERAAKDAERLRKSFEQLVSSINSKIALERAEAASTAALTGAQKFALDLMGKIRDGTVELNDERKRAVVVLLEELMVAERVNAARKESAKAEEEMAAVRASLGAATAREIETLKVLVDERAFELHTINMTREQIDRLRVARLDEAIARYESALNAVELEEAERRGLEERIRLLKILKGLEIATIDAANDVSAAAGLRRAWDDFKRAVDNDAAAIQNMFGNVMRGMEDAFVNFVRTGKLSFRDLIDTMISDLARWAFRKMAVSIGTSLFGGMQGFAEGGFPAPGKFALVGEHGPELIRPRFATEVVPAGKMGSNVTVNNTYHVDSRTDRASIVSMMEEGRKRTIASIRDMLNRKSPQI